MKGDAMSSTDLVRYDAACRALAEAKSVDEVKLIRDKASAIAAAARIAKNHGLEIDAAEIRIRAERRLGEMLKDGPKNQGTRSQKLTRVTGGAIVEPPESDVPSIADMGIDKKLSARSRAIAAIPAKDFEATLAEHREAQQAVTSRTMETLARKGAVHVSHNSGENEWYTPPEYIAAARKVMGAIDVDPASSKKANATVGASVFYTSDSDGLSRGWRGSVWMNPPYAQPLVSQFCDKLAAEYSAGNVTAACVLVNNATETTFFQTLARISDAICFPKGRIRFLGPQGNTGALLQGQAVLGIGVKQDLFAEAFGQFGVVLFCK
jgi:ParB family chromosome partitioning protein